MPDSTYDFLDGPEPGSAPAAPPHRGRPGWMSTGAWLLAGLVLGALVVVMLHTNKSANATGLPAGSAAANQAPNGPPAAGGFPGGPGGGFRGGLPGEQHIVGTLTAVGPSSITVTGNNGSATYPIESSTLLVKNGQRVSSPSALTVGDTVVVHVYPQNGSTHTEMVIDGVPAGGDDGGPDDNTGTTTET